MDVKDRLERTRYWLNDQWEKLPKAGRIRLFVLTPIVAVLLIAALIVYRPRGTVGPPPGPPQGEAVQAAQDYDLARLRAFTLEELREEESRRAAEVERAKGIGHFELVAVATEELDRVRLVLDERSAERR